MLREFKNAAPQPTTPGYRRRFTDSVLDLTVWYSPKGTIRGFQLCDDRDGRERTFTWHVDAGIVLLPSGAPDADTVLTQFQERAKALDPKLAALVAEKLESFLQPR